MVAEYIVLTPPTAEPVSVDDVKRWLRIDFSDDDELISELISDARRYCENLMRRSLAVQTIQLIQEFDHVAAGDISGPVDVGYDTWRLAERPDIPLFGNALIRLQCLMGPVISLTTVEYQLTRMDEPEWTTLATPDNSGNPTYRLDNYADPNEVNIFTILAATRFRLTFQAGYTTLPPDMRSKMRRLISFMYDNREAPIPDALNAELVGNRVFML